MMIPGPPQLTRPLQAFIRQAWENIPRTRIKICGLQDLESAFVAAEAGADFLGFNFVPNVRRRLEVNYARDLISQFRQVRFVPGRPTLVGVFSNQSPDEINNIAETTGVDMVQLSGNEEMQECAHITRPIIKAIHVRVDWPAEVTTTIVSTLLDRHSRAGHLGLLDRYAEEQTGGTGRTFDWSPIRYLIGSYRFLLAGGLTPDNVGQAVLDVTPWGVDVSSGVETNGKQSPEKIRAFIRAVQEADKQHNHSAGPLHRALSLLRSRFMREESPE